MQDSPNNSPTLPEVGEVQLWVLDAEHLANNVESYRTFLTPDELDRAARYRIGTVQEQFVASRGALRMVLGGYLGKRPDAVPIIYAANGKPVLLGSGLHFNISHTSGMALIAVAANRVGVDVERVRSIPNALGLVERFFSSVERKIYRELPVDLHLEAFFRGWVCKEAVIKAAGASVQYLDAFDVDIDPTHPAKVIEIRHPILAGDGWALAHGQVAPDYVSAIAMEELPTQARREN